MVSLVSVGVPRSEPIKRFGRIFVAAASSVVIGCSSQPIATDPSESPEVGPTRTASTEASPATSAASPSPRPTTSPPGSASVPPTPASNTSPSWVQITTVDGVTPPDHGLVGFKAGYVWYGWGRDALFSPDGMEWRAVELPGCSPQCTDKAAGNEAVERAATNGETVLLLGSYPTGADPRLQSFVWVSSDGVNWQRSDPIGKARGPSNDLPVDAWPIPGGWELAMGYTNRRDDSGDHTDILRSADGLHWQREATLAGRGIVDGAADAQGRRMLSIVAGFTRAFGPPAEQVAMVTSSDGRSWQTFDLPTQRGGRATVLEAAPVLSPDGEAGRWLVRVREYRPDAISDESCLGQTLWLSADLREWESLVPPNHDEWGRIFSADGQLITTACGELGAHCRTYLAALGEAEWPEINPQIAPNRSSLIGIAGGPADVLAVLDDGRVYQLR